MSSLSKTLRTRTREVVLLSTVACATAGMNACHRPSGSAGSVHAGSAGVSTALAQGKAGLRLEASAEKDVIADADPLVITYVVRNTGPVQRFRNDPGFVSFDVVSPSGSQLRPEMEAEPPSLGTEADVLIPEGGFIGQRVNLRCASSRFSPYPYGRGGNLCFWKFELSEPGEYRVVVRYAAPAIAGTNEYEAIERVADTVRVRYERRKAN